MGSRRCQELHRGGAALGRAAVIGRVLFLLFLFFLFSCEQGAINLLPAPVTVETIGTPLGRPARWSDCGTKNHRLEIPLLWAVARVRTVPYALVTAATLGARPCNCPVPQACASVFGRWPSATGSPAGAAGADTVDRRASTCHLFGPAAGRVVGRQASGCVGPRRRRAAPSLHPSPPTPPTFAGRRPPFPPRRLRRCRRRRLSPPWPTAMCACSATRWQPQRGGAGATRPGRA